MLKDHHYHLVFIFCFLYVIILFVPNFRVVAQTTTTLSCQTCVSRINTKIYVISDGASIGQTDSFPWFPMSEAAVTASDSLRTQLYWLGTNGLNEQSIITNIQTAIADQASAILLAFSFSSDRFLSAVADIQKAGIPLFGFAEGFSIAVASNVSAFFGQNDYDSAFQAGQKFIANSPAHPHGLCLDVAEGSVYTTDRCRGYADAFATVGGTVRIVSIDPVASTAIGIASLQNVFQSDPSISSVLLTGPQPITILFAALNGLPKKLIGVFETSPDVIDRLQSREVMFAISQQPFLQVYAAVTTAVLYATTGNLAAQPFIQTGPVFISEDVPVSEFCNVVGHPTCAEEGATIVQNCPCIDKSTMQFNMQTHDLNGNSFWIPLREGASKAAADLNVTFQYVGNGDTTDLAAQAARVVAASTVPGMSGVSTTNPNPSIFNPAIIQAAQSTPVATLNSGNTEIDTLWNITAGQAFLHIGSLEFLGGELLGKLFAERGFSHALCINPEADNLALTQRCEGAAVHLQSVTEVITSLTNEQVTENDLNAALSANPNTDCLITSHPNGLQAILVVASQHSGLGTASFDINSESIGALLDGTLDYTIHQQPYLQGYLPLLYLFLRNYTYGQTPLADITPTGPFLITKSNALLWTCETPGYPECVVQTEFEVPRSSGYNIAIWTLAALNIFYFFCLSVFLFIHRKKLLMRASSIPFMYAILLGGTIASVGIILYACEPSTGTCTTALWLTLVGVLLIFASVFTKQIRTWKMTRDALQFRMRKVLSIIDLLPAVILIIGLQVIILIVWTAVSIPTKHATNRGLQPHQYTYVCDSENGIGFAAATIAYVGVVIVLGCFLAYKTRKLPTIFRESRWIGWGMYNFLILGVILVIMAFAVNDSNAQFFVISLCVLIAVFIQISLLFLPKFYLIMAGRGDEQPVLSSKRSNDDNSKRTTVESDMISTSSESPVEIDLSNCDLSNLKGIQTYQTKKGPINIIFPTS